MTRQMALVGFLQAQNCTNLPSSWRHPESRDDSMSADYYQEIGRAGRDSLPSSCVLLFNYADKNTHDFFIEGSYPTLEVIQDVYDALVATGLKRIELSTSEIAKRAVVSNEMAVQSSLYILERAGHLEHVRAQQVEHQEHLRGPAPDPFHLGERRYDLFIGQLVECLNRKLSRRYPRAEVL